jgi:hypothetical protein
MKNLIENLFPQGYRKLLVSLIALAVGVVLDKFGGGLSDNATHSLIAIVAIFSGGNVMEHLAEALKIFAGTRVGQILEDVIPGDQGLGVPKELTAEEKAEAAHAAVGQLAAAQGDHATRVDELEKKLAVQAQNMGQVVQILNTMRSANVQRPAAPQQGS